MFSERDQNLNERENSSQGTEANVFEGHFLSRSAGDLGPTDWRPHSPGRPGGKSSQQSRKMGTSGDGQRPWLSPSTCLLQAGRAGDKV